MVNRVRKTNFIPQGNAHSAGHVVNSDGRPIYDQDGTLAKRKFVRFTPGDAIKPITADTTLTAADDGKVIVFDSTTSRIVSLPRAKDCPGCRFRFVWKQLTTTSTGHGISPNSNDGVGAGVHPSVTAVANKDIYSAAATDAVTDRLEIVSDGAAAGTWEIADYVGTFTKEA